MRSDNSEIKRDNHSVSGGNAVASLPKKIRFGMKLYPETLEMVDAAFQKDNCCSRSEFIEKAVRFYIGYLHNQDHTAIEYLAPQLIANKDSIGMNTTEYYELQEGSL